MVLLVSLSFPGSVSTDTSFYDKFVTKTNSIPYRTH